MDAETITYRGYESAMSLRRGRWAASKRPRSDDRARYVGVFDLKAP